eukprot:TRINITY_DN419_c0_g1_i2.p1 TRINITY_DN419_c0_g1~~TRINITY_DN419_c0_g1_i2.p1  ORF type:complete len:418 (+),score=80.71 TRINITY_DN419_c0_g1_i2:92-1345(+)
MQEALPAQLMIFVWAASIFLAFGASEPTVNTTANGGPACPGAIQMQAYGQVQQVQLVNAYWNVPGERAGPVQVNNGVIEPEMKGRTYFAEECTPGKFEYTKYSAMKLLGSRLRYMTDLSKAGCGCNGALYLTSLQQCSNPSQCFDHYCDANNVCGVRCDEIDLQEANMFAWHSTLHVEDDGSGIGAGYGGGGNNWNGERDWTKEQYGPGGRCIDTRLPFQVEVAFPVDSAGTLRAMDVKLSQSGKNCNLSAEVGEHGYPYGGRSGMAQLTQSLRKGMTPIISYWSSDDMLWMDGKGADGLGPCATDDKEACGKSVSFYNFVLESLEPNSLPNPPQKCSNLRYAQCGGQLFAGDSCCPHGTWCMPINQYWSQCEPCEMTWDSTCHPTASQTSGEAIQENITSAADHGARRLQLRSMYV